MALASAVPAAAQTDAGEEPALSSGWYPWDPYQFMTTRYGRPHLSGLDVELVRAIAERAGYRVDYGEMSWVRHLEALREGAVDMAAGATFTRRRAEFAHFSVPYRQETNVLYVRRGDPAGSVGSVEELLELLAAGEFRLAVVEGFVYADERINDVLDDPANAPRIVRSANDVENLRKLVAGEVDGVLADRLVVATAAWRLGVRDLVHEAPMQVATPIHLIFSRASVAPETVAAFDRAIAEIEDSGAYGRIVSEYMYPVLLTQAVDRGWFHAIEVLGVITFSLAGAVLAYRGGYDVFGALVLGALPAVGGGVMRDLVSGNRPLTIATNPIFLELVVLTVAAGYVLLKLLPHVIHTGDGESVLRRPLADRILRWLLNVFDAAGLGAFTVGGVIVAVKTNSQPLWLWGPLLATLSGSGGGILRDVLRQDSAMPKLKGELYPEIALVWGLLLSLFLVWQTHILNPEHIHLAIVVTLVGAFLTRMAAVHLRIGSPTYG